MKLPFTAALALLLTGCNSTPQKDISKKTEKEKQEVTKLNKLSMTNIEFERRKVCANDGLNKVNYNLYWPVNIKDDTLKSKIYTSLFQVIQPDVISAKIEDPVLQDSVNIDSTIGNWANQFIKIACKNQKKSKLAMPWEFQINTESLINHNGIFSYKIQKNNFTGGAHGLSTTTYLNFDLHEKELISINMVFDDTSEVKKIVRKAFRDSLSNKNDEIFDSNNNAFKLTQNIGLKQHGVIFHYNAYEVLPYSEGSLKIIIPIDQLKKVMQNSLYKRLIKKKRVMALVS